MDLWWSKEIHNSTNGTDNKKLNHGGRRFIKMNNNVIAYHIEEIKIYPVITLQEMQVELRDQFNTQFSIQT